MKSHEVREHLKDIGPEVLWYFVKDELCRSCNLPMSKHRVVFEEDMDTEIWVVCWYVAEDGQTAVGGTNYNPEKWRKNFCVTIEDHPKLQSREEFEELYT